MKRVDGKRGPIPKKRMRLKDWVRREIVRGSYPPGSRLPDRDWFMREFATTRQLVTQAFAELRSEGFVRAVRGHGTRVVDVLPFANRYLLLVKGAELDAGSHLCAPALAEAAKVVERTRGVFFEVRGLVDAPPESDDYAAMLARVRRHHYAGVFTQQVTKGHDLDVVSNVDDVPCAFMGRRNELTQGSRAVELEGYTDFTGRVLGLHLESCRDAGKGSVAIFKQLPVSRDPGSFEAMAQKVAAFGLRLVPNGYHAVAMDKWDEPVFRQLVRLFLASDAGRDAEAIVLTDDNFLKPFAEELKAALGRSAGKRYFITCLGNAPLLPRTDLSVCFHGVDWTATLSAFVDYSEACRATGRPHAAPSVVLF